MTTAKMSSIGIDADALVKTDGTRPFTGAQAGLTAAAGTNTTQLATTAFVRNTVEDLGFDVPIGVEWTTNATSPTLLQVDQYGVPVTLSAGDWAAHSIYKAIRRCTLADNGTVNAYYAQYDTGTADASASTTLEDATKTWAINQYQNQYVLINSGTGAGQERLIVSNTATQLTVATWATNPTTDSVYSINTISYTGLNGQVMVEIPKFYYKTTALTNKYRYIISRYPLLGYKVHPAFVVDGVEKDHIYISAFEGSVYDVTTPAAACVNTIQITAEPTSSGNLTITLDGNYVFTVAILDADSKEGVVDKIVAAGAKTSYQGTVWTPAKTAADTLTYTAGSTGLKTTVLMPTACGVTSTITKTNAGAGGYVTNDANGYDFAATTGDKMCSIAGVKPMSGWNNATATLPNMRVLAQNRGTGWNLLDFNSVCAIQMLFIIRNATLNSQAVYRGVVDITDATAGSTFNNAINTGYTAGVGTNGVDLGNASGECPDVKHYKNTAEAAKAFSIFGIENFWGNIWKWIDGLNIKANRNPWIADHDFATDLFSHPYVNTGLTTATATGQEGASIIYSSTYDYLFVPATVVTDATFQTYMCDYIYTDTGNRSALLGGSWSYASYGGVLCWHLPNDGSYVYRILCARLAFK